MLFARAERRAPFRSYFKRLLSSWPRGGFKDHSKPLPVAAAAFRRLFIALPCISWGTPVGRSLAKGGNLAKRLALCWRRFRPYSDVVVFSMFGDIKKSFINPFKKYLDFNDSD